MEAEARRDAFMGASRSHFIEEKGEGNPFLLPFTIAHLAFIIGVDGNFCPDAIVFRVKKE